MKDQGSDQVIVDLIRDLESREDQHRRAAIEEITEKGITEDRVLELLIDIAESDPNSVIRSFARNALSRLEVTYEPSDMQIPANEIPPAAARDPEPITGFQDVLRVYNQQLIGFFGWYIINGLVFYAALGSQGLNYGENWSILCITFPANLFSLILLALIKPTRRLAFGVLVAIASNFVIALALGVSENAACFYPFFSRQ